MPMYRVPVTKNPLLQIAGLVVGAVVTVGAVLVGAVLIAFAIGFAFIVGLAIYVRLWWLRRRGARPGGRGGSVPGGRGRATPGDRGQSRPKGEIVEVEYTVVEERTVEDKDRR